MNPTARGVFIRPGHFRIYSMGFAAALAAAPIAATAERFETLPSEIRAVFDQARQDCHRGGDALHVADAAGFAEKADFNGDGHADYIVHLAALVCPSLGLSEYCGSSGCMVTIFVSQGDRLREVESENFQGLAITAPVGGKQSIAFAAHGTTCGHSSGADTCYGVLSWTPKGFKTTYMRAEPAALKARAAVPPSAYPSADKDPHYDWKLVAPAAGKKGPSIAMSDASPQGMKVVVACAEKVPVLVLSFPPATDGPPPGGKIMVELGESRPGEPHADLVLQPVQDKTAWIGQLSRAALGLMQTASQQQGYGAIPAAWTIADRDYWVDMPALSLTRFIASTKPVLSGCAAALR